MISGGDHVPAPATQERRGEDAHERTLHEHRVHKERIGHEELVPEDEEVDRPERNEEAAADPTALQLRATEEFLATDREVHQRCHQREEDAIEEGRERDDGDALARFNAFARENENGEEEPSADDARCQRRSELPEHDHDEGPVPREVLFRKVADAHHVGVIAQHHAQRSEQHPKGGGPGPAYGVERGPVGVLPDQKRRYSQADSHRQEHLAQPECAQVPASIIVHRCHGATVNPCRRRYSYRVRASAWP